MSAAELLLWLLGLAELAPWTAGASAVSSASSGLPCILAGSKRAAFCVALTCLALLWCTRCGVKKDCDTGSVLV